MDGGAVDVSVKWWWVFETSSLGHVTRAFCDGDGDVWKTDGNQCGGNNGLGGCI